jgi:di/tricarboxylate transporter
MDARNPRRRTPSVLVCAASTALATVVAYLSWLGVSTDKTVGQHGHQIGPYQTWQVVALAVTLVLVAGVVGSLRQPRTATAVIPAVATACFGLIAVRDPAADTSWAVGALLVLIAGLVGIGAAAYSVDKVVGLTEHTINHLQRTRAGGTTRAPTGTRAEC